MLIGAGEWTLDKDLKVIKYKQQPLKDLLHGGIFFDTPELAIHYKRFILKTEYGKMGAKKIPAELDEEETLKREVSKLKNRYEHSNEEMLGVFFEEPLHETSLWKKLMKITEEYNKDILEWKMKQVEYGEKIAEAQRKATNFYESGALGANTLIYSRDFENKNYITNTDETVIALSKEFKEEEILHKRKMVEKDLARAMIDLIEETFESHLGRLWIRQALVAKQKYEKALFKLELIKLRNRFFSGCNVFRRVFIDDLKETDIKYNQDRKIYNLIFYTKNGPTFLKWIGETNKRKILMDHKGRVHHNLSLCFIDESVTGVPMSKNSESGTFWEEEEYW